MIYGRFDFAYGEDGFKLLEYNADTPTALVETAVQWHWVQDVYGEGGDQWNMVHELLVERWKELLPRLPGDRVYFLHTNAEHSGEDFMTVGYMVEAAREAGLHVRADADRADGPASSTSASSTARAARCAASSSSTPGSGWSTRSSPTPRWSGWATTRARRCGSSRSGRCCGPTRASCRSSGGCSRTTRTCSPRSSRARSTSSRATSSKPLLAREGANSVIVIDGDEADRGPDQGYGEEGLRRPAVHRPRRLRRQPPVLGRVDRRHGARRARHPRVHRAHDQQPVAVRAARHRRLREGAPPVFELVLQVLRLHRRGSGGPRGRLLRARPAHARQARPARDGGQPAAPD